MSETRTIEKQITIRVVVPREITEEEVVKIISNGMDYCEFQIQELIALKQGRLGGQQKHVEGHVGPN